MSTVQERVIKVITEQLGSREGEVQPSSSIVNDLGADSLDHVEIIMALEEEFEIEIPDERAEQTDTVQQIIELVEDLQKS